MSTEELTITFKGSDQSKAAFASLLQNLREADDNSKAAEKSGTSFFSGIAQVASGVLAAGVIQKVAGGIADIGSKALSLSGDVKQVGNDLQSTLGLTKQEAAELGQVAVNVFKNNWGDSVSDAGKAVGEVQQQLGALLKKNNELTPDKLQSITEQALTLRDVFGLEVNESVSTARTLMEKFGMSSSEAFNFIAAGMQKGLNRSGDFLDTINEYSTQFSNGGASADQFFSILETGMAGGALGTDKAADAFKEFRVRIQDGSDLTAASLEAIGINSEEMLAKLASGEMTAAQAFDTVLQSMQETDDKTVLMQAGVGLLGTQFEDLGQDAVLAMDMSKTKVGELGEVTDDLGVKYDNFGAVSEGIWRQFMVALLPLSDALLGLANEVTPHVIAAITGFQEMLPPVIAVVTGAFTGLKDTIAALLPVILMMADFIKANAEPIMFSLAAVITAVAIPALIGLGTTAAGAAATAIAALLPILVPIALIGAAAFALYKAWDSNFLGIRDITNTVIGFIQSFIQSALADIQAWWTAHGVTVIATVTNLFNTVLSVAQAVGNALSAWIQSVLGRILSWWDSHGESVMTVVRGLFNIIKTIFSTTLDVISGIVTTVLGAIAGFWSAHGDKVMEIIKVAWQFIETITGTLFDTLGSLFDAFAAAFEGDWSTFGTKLRQAWDTLWSGITGAFGTVKDSLLGALGGLISEMISRFAATDWSAIGGGIIRGIANGITAGLGIIRDAAVQAAMAALEAAKGFLGIKSPSKEFAKLGTASMQGFAQGIRESMSLPADMVLAGAGGMLDRTASMMQSREVIYQGEKHVHLHIHTNGDYREELADLGYLQAIAR
jgi:phage-related minor tail protein